MVLVDSILFFVRRPGIVMMFYRFVANGDAEDEGVEFLTPFQRYRTLSEWQRQENRLMRHLVS